MPFPPQASTLDKDHGRIETRQIWCAPTDPKTIGLAGVAQVVRIHCHTQEVRQGKVIKKTDDTRFALTTYWPQEADPDRLLQLARSHWSIENGQHYRRDRTQDEDAARCVKPPRRALSPCSALWPFSCSSAKLRVKTAKNRCPTLSATFTAILGG